MLPWVFVILLSMPSFGGPVSVTWQTTDEAACLKLRKVVVRQFDDLGMKGEVTPCAEKADG